MQQRARASPEKCWAGIVSSSYTSQLVGIAFSESRHFFCKKIHNISAWYIIDRDNLICGRLLYHPSWSMLRNYDNTNVRAECWSCSTRNAVSLGIYLLHFNRPTSRLVWLLAEIRDIYTSLAEISKKGLASSKNFEGMGMTMLAPDYLKNYIIIFVIKHANLLLLL